LKTPVTILRGRHRGATGFISGDLHRQNPYTSKTLVWLGEDEFTIVKLGDLTEAGQFELDLAATG
jgi:hypothetical protein